MDQGAPAPDQAAFEQQSQLNNELERRVIEHQVKIQQEQEMFALRMQQKTQEAALDRQLKASQTAADIARKNAQQRAQLGIA